MAHYPGERLACSGVHSRRAAWAGSAEKAEPPLRTLAVPPGVPKPFQPWKLNEAVPKKLALGTKRTWSVARNRTAAVTLTTGKSRNVLPRSIEYCHLPLDRPATPTTAMPLAVVGLRALKIGLKSL